MNPGNLVGLQGNAQIPNTMKINDLLRNQMEQSNKPHEQDKRGENKK